MTSNKPEQPEGALEEGKVIALRSNLPPHFNTQRVIQGYTSQAPASVSTLWRFKHVEPVRYKVGKKNSQPRYMMLHLEADERGVRYKISSPEGEWNRSVTREAIMEGVAKAEGSWVIIFPDHPVRFDRDELIDALHKLERKLRKRQAA